MENLPSEGALNNVRVLDLTHVLAGSLAGYLLGTFGAEVIKVESSYHEDSFRKNISEVKVAQEGVKPGSRTFEEFNRNKKSVAVNMKTLQGRQVVYGLASLSDVVLENYSPGTLEKWGMGYEDLRKIQPSIIMCSMQGMGRSGPRLHYVTWGPTLLAYAGFTYLWNHNGKSAPVGSQISYPDYVAAVQADIAIMAALEHRQHAGSGQFIELAQVESTLSLLPTTFLDYFINHKEPAPRGNRVYPGSPSGCYKCLGDDKWCVIAIESDQDWERFCRAIGNPAWCQEERFFTMIDRVRNLEELDQLVGEWTKTRTPQEVMQTLQVAGVPAGVVQDAQDLLNDPNLRARHMLYPSDNPAFTGMLFPGVAVKLSRTPGDIRRHAPYLGEDNDYVFRDLLGMTPSEVELLVHEGVIY